MHDYVSSCAVEKIASGVQLRKNFLAFLKTNAWVHSKAFRNRKVFFDKLPDAILERKDAKNRLSCFFVALDILKNSKKFSVHSENKSEFALQRCDRNGIFVEVHLREEEKKKDRRLFFVSCFTKKPPSNSSLDQGFQDTFVK